MSVRLKLTLSYAGFLMLAGALLLAAVWVFMLRDLPEVSIGAGGGDTGRNALARNFAPAAGAVLVFLLVFGLWEGGFSPSHARPSGPHHPRHTHGRDRIARPPDPASGPR